MNKKYKEYLQRSSFAQSLNFLQLEMLYVHGIATTEFFRRNSIELSSLTVHTEYVY